MRREEVCAAAGVAVSWLARLEQGRAGSVSPDVLNALGRALQLDATELVYLFTLAGLQAGPGDVVAPEVTPALRVLLDELEPNPAYLLDRSWDIIAWNQAEAALFPDLLSYAGGPPNLLRLVFTDPALRRLMADYDEEARRLIAQFRVHEADWPGDPGVNATIAALVRESPLFARLWATDDVMRFVSTRRVFDHPVAGRLEFDHHRFGVLDQVGTQLVVYTSVPGTDSSLRLHDACEP
jgi:transcriptional regulator with XRE-family HTH domain